MPAETHQRGTTVTAADIIDLLEVTTVGELVEATVRCLRDDGGQT